MNRLTRKDLHPSPPRSPEIQKAMDAFPPRPPLFPPQQSAPPADAPQSEPELSEEELRIWIAERCGTAGFFLLKKQGYWWRPNSQGYTSDINQAGRYTEEQARERVRVGGYDDDVTMHPAPLPDYTRDLNAMAEAERQWFTCDMDELIEEYATELQRLCYEEGEKRPWFMATAGQRAKAFYRVLKNES